MAPHPELGVASGLIAAFGYQIEELVGAVDHVDATSVRGIRVEDFARAVLEEDTEAFPVFKPGIRGHVVEYDGVVGDRFRRERRPKVVAELRLERRDPRKGPTHA